jgi:CheY-like chemotaxis protein
VPAPTQPPPDSDPERLVLIADSDADSATSYAATIADWGLIPMIVHDGVEAILAVQRALPRAVVLDAALPRMFGFQVCELIKRNESLRHIRVALIGAIHHRERYRRAPSDLYGADIYVERPDLPDALRPMLRDLGLDVSGAPVPEPAPKSQPPPEPRLQPEPERVPKPRYDPPPAVAPEPDSTPPAPVAPEPRFAPPSPVAEEPELSPPPADEEPLGEAMSRALKLARVVVSDVVLYNEEKFDRAARDGNVLEGMKAEVQEARKLFEARVDPSVRETRDFLGDEFQRVARERASR